MKGHEPYVPKFVRIFCTLSCLFASSILPSMHVLLHIRYVCRVMLRTQHSPYACPLTLALERNVEQEMNAQPGNFDENRLNFIGLQQRCDFYMRSVIHPHSICSVECSIYYPQIPNTVP